MGLTKKLRKTYSTPPHPWQAERIEEERKIKKEYGLKNKKEIWKISSKLKGFKNQAKNLTAKTDKQAIKEKKALIERLNKLGLLSEDATMDNVLEISLENLLNRRLQSIILSRGLARTMRQSRQMITHGHIKLENKSMNAPSYLVTLQEETKISFSQASTFSNPDHPEINLEEKEDSKTLENIKKASEKNSKIENKEKVTEKTTTNIQQPVTPKA